MVAACGSDRTGNRCRRAFATVHEHNRWDDLAPPANPPVSRFFGVGVEDLLEPSCNGNSTSHPCPALRPGWRGRWPPRTNACRPEKGRVPLHSHPPPHYVSAGNCGSLRSCVRRVLPLCAACPPRSRVITRVSWRSETSVPSPQPRSPGAPCAVPSSGPLSAGPYSESRPKRFPPSGPPAAAVPHRR
jgi:hypothetical protein